MKNKSQEQKTKEFIKDLSRRYQEPDPHESLLLSSVINEAIQFGSLLTIERAKEKVEKELLFPDDCLLFRGEPFVDREKVLKAIEESSL